MNDAHVTLPAAADSLVPATGSLLAQRRFWPFFWTQFLGAFNDNFFKNALVILFTYQAVDLGAITPETLVPLAGGIFILPFFLFSGLAGLVADKFDKDRVIRAVKLLEIVIMSAGAFAFLTHRPVMLLVILFFMGLQSTIFGPTKYSVLPQLVGTGRLVEANALVEMGTFLSILLGTLAGGLSIALPGGERWVSAGILTLATAGYVASRFVVSTPSESPHLRIPLDPVGPTFEILGLLAKNRTILLSVLGISWFWFFGAAFLSLFPTYTRGVLFGNESVATAMLGVFSVGIGVGSMVCERLSHGRLELGLVPLGTLGMSLFTFDLAFGVGHPWGAPGAAGELIGIADFVTRGGGLRVLVDLCGVALFGGLYIVPLYTLIQSRSAPGERSRVIAGNNIVNSAFMVGSAIALIALGKLGLDQPQVFAVLAVANLAISFYIYGVIPEFFLRFLAFLLSNTLYRLEVRGAERIPAEGPVILVSNHVSFVDWLIVGGACRRPARFVMYWRIAEAPLVRFLFRDAKTIPIAPAKENAVLLDESYDRIAAELRDGQVVCLFPEGGITRDGQIQPFRTGIERVLAETPVPVIPMALNGLWGSWFSRRDGEAFKKRPRRFWSRIRLTIGEPLAPEGLTAAALEDHVRRLWTEGGAP